MQGQTPHPLLVWGIDAFTQPSLGLDCVSLRSWQMRAHGRTTWRQFERKTTLLSNLIVICFPQ